MKHKAIAAVFAAGLFASLTASAGEYNFSWGVISRLENFGDDMTVYGLDFSPNPAGCAKPDAGKLKPSLSAVQKDGLVRMLTGAYTAGRQVKVMLSSTECSGDFPAIYGVHVR